MLSASDRRPGLFVAAEQAVVAPYLFSLLNLQSFHGWVGSWGTHTLLLQAFDPARELCWLE